MGTTKRQMKMENSKKTIVRRVIETPTELRVREADGGDAPSRTITGYAVLFGVPSSPLWSDGDGEAREVIAPGAITRELLDAQDIKMTMFHDRQLILARSRQGQGTLKYTVDGKGVAFEFDAPRTADGDKALELVRRGDISGCSFAFSTRYYDRDCVERKVERVGGRTLETYTVRQVLGVYDFTLAADPAYPDTSVEAREFLAGLRGSTGSGGRTSEGAERLRSQLREMRRAASAKLSGTA